MNFSSELFTVNTKWCHMTHAVLYRKQLRRWRAELLMRNAEHAAFPTYRVGGWPICLLHRRQSPTQGSQMVDLIVGIGDLCQSAPVKSPIYIDARWAVLQMHARPCALRPSVSHVENNRRQLPRAKEVNFRRRTDSDKLQFYWSSATDNVNHSSRFLYSIAQLPASDKLTFIYTVSEKWDSRNLEYLVCSCKSVAMKFSMWYPDGLSY